MAPTRRSWDTLSLPDWCLDAISSKGYTEPTPSQAAAIPLFLANSDVVVEAPTGSGKSLSFLIPLVLRILRRFSEEATPSKRGHITAVVLAPTRELAFQLHQALMELIAFHQPTAAILPYLQSNQLDSAADDQTNSQNGKRKNNKKRSKNRPLAAANGLEIVGDDNEHNNDPSAPITKYTRRPDTTEPVIVPQLVVGGWSKKLPADLAAFARQGSNLIVGTPGRVAKFLASNSVNSTESFEALVLDEADRLLDLGFGADLQQILSFVPKQRRTFLCSASINDAISELIKVNLRNPKRIVVRVQARTKENATSSRDIEEKKTPASLLNTYITLPSSHKLPGVVQILSQIEPRPLRTIIFMASCFSVTYFSTVLPSIIPEDYNVVSLHSKLVRNVRERQFIRFVSATSPVVLLCTDVASRGLDVANVDLVINIDPPTDPKAFLHRCGRTARAGRRGLAVTMLRPGRETDGYVPYLAARETPVVNLTTAMPALADVPTQARDTATALTKAIRDQVLKDRRLHELSHLGFVSWARSFKEHKAESIFRSNDLDWNDLGHAWGLVQLPKMPELRAAGITDRSLGLGDQVDLDAIAFKDKAKEAIRQQELRMKMLRKVAAEVDAEIEAEANGGQKPDKKYERKRNSAWSNKHNRDDLRVERRDKKRRKREAEQVAKMTPEEREKKAKVDALVAQVREQNLAAAAASEAEVREARKRVNLASKRSRADDSDELDDLDDTELDEPGPPPKFELDGLSD